MSATSSRRRGFRLIAVPGLLAAVVAMSACGTGQITQTASQVAAVPGTSIDLPSTDNPVIGLRNLVVAYSGPGGYAAGSSAPLVVHIVNNSAREITLTEVTSPAATSVVLVDASATPSPTASPSPEAAPTPTSAETPTGTPETPTATAPAEPTPTSAPPAGEARFTLRIPALSLVALVPGQGRYLQLAGLKAPLLPGQSVPLRFTFSGDEQITGEIVVPLAPPVGAVPRATPEPIHQEPAHE